jgi:hypothetical protein
MNDIGIEFKEVGKAFVRDDGSRQVVLEKVNFSIPAGNDPEAHTWSHASRQWTDIRGW